MKSSKRTRIEKMVKRYPEVSSYLLNSFSRKVYTHADLDKIEELLEEGFFDSEFKEGWYDGAIHFYSNTRGTLRGEFHNLQSSEGVWNGLYHFTALKRAIKVLKLSPYWNLSFKTAYQFWSNPEFECAIDVNRRQINWWANEAMTADLEKFKESIEDIMSSISFRGSRNEFSYKLVENPDELLLGFGIVENGGNAIDDPYLDWSHETMTLEKVEGEVAGFPATIVYLKRDGETVSIGLEDGDGSIRLHSSDKEGGAIETLWHRKGYDKIIWDDNVPEIIIEEEIVEVDEDDL